LTGSEAVFAFRSHDVESPDLRGLPTAIKKPQAVRNERSSTVRMQILGAQADLRGLGLEQLSGRVNHLRGADPEKWQTHVPTYRKVRYDNVYRGIDLVYYGSSRQLEYDFIVAPGASPDAITLGFESPWILPVPST